MTRSKGSVINGKTDTHIKQNKIWITEKKTVKTFGMLFTTPATVQQILISADWKPLMHRCIIGFIINNITMIEIKCNKSFDLC